MRIGTALLTAACVVSGIVVIEAHLAYAAEAPVQTAKIADGQEARPDEI